MLLRFKKIWDSEMGELSSIELEGAVGSWIIIYVLWADKESVVNFKYLQQKQFNLVILGYLSYCHWPLICTYCFCVKSLSEPSFVIIIKGTVHQPTKLLSYAQYAPNYAYLGAYLPNMHIWVHIWARQIWSSGVSLKRSCKMQFRRIGLRSIGPSSQKLWPNQIFGRFPHCNYNVKLKIAGKMSFMGL